MYVDSNKVILTDCDGVLLDWIYSFHVWMSRHGYVRASAETHCEYKLYHQYNLDPDEATRLIRMFNESAAIGQVPPWYDAMHYVRKLHEEHGFVFHVITSLSSEPNAQVLRTKNLRRVFGDTAMERFVYLDTGEDKNEALLPYINSDCYWLEDKPENADIGREFGLKALLINQPYNSNYNGEVPRMNSWKEIYDRILGL